MTKEQYKQLRVSIGSQQFVADVFGCSPFTIMNKELGRSEISEEEAEDMESLAEIAEDLRNEHGDE